MSNIDKEKPLFRGVSEIIGEDYLATTLNENKKLRVYYGVDPTGAQIHLGHYVILRKLRILQDMGHEVILLIGDFTARIGDPTDRDAMRVPLTHEDVLANAKTYQEQVSGILRFEGENPIQMKYNGEWLDPLTFKDVIEIAAHFTAQQMLERDMFQERINSDKPIGLHEFLYPLMQGYDSVAMDVDMELGGSDQLFNMLAGRTLLRKMKDKEKIVITTQLLEGTDGRKMSKSYKNIIAITDEPKEMYGKLMSIKDELIERYFELCTDVSSDELESMHIGENPRDAKMKLAKTIVLDIHGEDAAQAAEDHFVNVFQKQEKPAEIETAKIDGGERSLVDVLLEINAASSKSEAKRTIEQGGVKVDDEVVNDAKATIVVSEEPTLIQKGKLLYKNIVSK